MSAPEQQPLTPIADHVLNLLEAASRAGRDGRIKLAECQEAHLANGRNRVLTELRGAAAEQLLADMTAMFALKLLRAEAPKC